MIILKIFDREGTELAFGDIVKISDGKKFTFFCEVKYLEKARSIAPFHTFSFHSVVKVDKFPDNAIKCKDPDYDYWYLYHGDAEDDGKAEDFDQYLLSWKECERLIDKSCFQIFTVENKSSKQLSFIEP
jgi:hypothetical protein